MRRGAGPVATLAFCLVALAGCGYPFGDDVRDVAHPNPPARLVDPGCPQRAADLPAFDGYGELVGAGDPPAGFLPVRVQRCILNSAYGDETSERYEVVDQRASTVTTALLDALRLPDQEFVPGSHGACPAVAYSPAYLLLVADTGRAVIPRLPQDPCGEPRDEVQTAIDGLGLGTTATHPFTAPG